MQRVRSQRRKSGFEPSPKLAQLLGFRPPSLGQSCPQRCPHPEASGCPLVEPLGAPLSLRDVARFIGCSPWTVRQTLVPQGLPVFRSGAGGKLIFYTNQVVRWLESHQGGNA